MSKKTTSSYGQIPALDPAFKMNNPAQQLLVLLEQTAISEWSSSEAREAALELARKCVKHELLSPDV